MNVPMPDLPDPSTPIEHQLATIDDLVAKLRPTKSRVPWPVVLLASVLVSLVLSLLASALYQQVHNNDQASRCRAELAAADTSAANRVVQIVAARIEPDGSIRAELLSRLPSLSDAIRNSIAASARRADGNHLCP